MKRGEELEERGKEVGGNGGLSYRQNFLINSTSETIRLSSLYKGTNLMLPRVSQFLNPTRLYVFQIS